MLCWAEASLLPSYLQQQDIYSTFFSWQVWQTQHFVLELTFMQASCSSASANFGKFEDRSGGSPTSAPYICLISMFFNLTRFHLLLQRVKSEEKKTCKCSTPHPQCLMKHCLHKDYSYTIYNEQHKSNTKVTGPTFKSLALLYQKKKKNLRHHPEFFPPTRSPLKKWWKVMNIHFFWMDVEGRQSLHKGRGLEK